MIYLIIAFLLIIIGLAQFTLVEEIEHLKNYDRETKSWFMAEAFSYSMVLPLMGGLAILTFATLERHVFLILLAFTLMLVTGYHLTVRVRKKRLPAIVTMVSGILVILYLFFHSQI